MGSPHALQKWLIPCLRLHKRSGAAPFAKRVVDYVETLPLPLQKGGARFACEAVSYLEKTIVVL